MPDNTILKLYSKPLALFLSIIGLIFVVEFVLMKSLFARLELTDLKLALLDALLLSAVITPALYLLFFVPLRRHVDSLRKAGTRIDQLTYAIQKSQELGHVGTWNLDLVENELVWTDEVYRIFGVPTGTRLTYDAFLGRVHPDDRDRVDRQWQAALDGEAYDIKHRLLIDGKVKWVREKAELTFDDDGRPVKGVGFVQDITEIKSLEEKAIRTAQLATIGELTAMIAHEVNNPLSGVIGYAQVVANRSCDDCRNTDLLQRIIREGDRIAKIVGGLLAFSYHSGGVKEVRGVRPIIADALSLFDNQIRKKGIRLDVAVDDSLPRVCCNAQQIEQVILNIVRNAFQALQEGTLNGEEEKIIRIRAESTTFDSRPYLQITIANNGPNIPERLLARIREPFFTTKPAGIGTGLGLSISSDILHDHDGELEIRSNPGEFTEMILRLPVAPC